MSTGRRVSAAAVMCAVVASASTGCPMPAVASETIKTIALAPLVLNGSIAGKKKKKVAVDLSGIACMPPSGSARTCLVVNDENKNAQFLTFQGDIASVGATVPIIGDEPDPQTLGTAPDVACPKKGDFAELDGEGVAFSEPYFYVVGSHGCSRKSAEFRLSSFVLARIRVDATGKPAAAGLGSSVETTYRLADVLQRAKGVSDFFGRALETADGLNIEGIAVSGDDIWLGLRGPLDPQSNAFLVQASAADLFAPGHTPSQMKEPTVKTVSLDKRGIRDLTTLPDGRLLILAGAMNKAEVPFQLFVYNPVSGERNQLGELQPIKQNFEGEMVVGKAEAIMVLGVEAGVARIVVQFDGLPQGAPHLASVPIQ